jgi:prepilin-type N-terminal cleavage/methylation domain-containing protein
MRPISSSIDRRSAGFSLLELLVAMAVFMVIGGAAMQAFRVHVPLFTAQQNQSALNFTLRNAAAQMQIDVVNAGNGFYSGADITAWPIGVTVQNNDPGTSSCYDSTAHTYGSGCFDKLTVISTDVTVPLAHPIPNGSSPTNPCGNPSDNMAKSAILEVQPISGTLDAYAANFKAGDQILIVKADGSQYTTTVISKDGWSAGSGPNAVVKFQHNGTNDDGTNSNDPTQQNYDPLGISWQANSKLGTEFCNTDWVLKLAPVQYYVDASDPTNPKLMRSLPLSKATNNKDVIAEQIIGFKVGASVKDADGDYDFRYNSSNPSNPTDPNMVKGYNNDWTSIRAVRMTIIGRTPPSAAATANYRNGFDQGPYRVEAISVVVNPRNLSMND